MKTSELTGAALDWAVANLENVPVNAPGYLWGIGQFNHRYSTDWSQGGPIIERERFNRITMNVSGGFTVSLKQTIKGKDDEDDEPAIKWVHGVGPSLLIAAMRCYVASKLGDTVELPEELL